MALTLTNAIFTDAISHPAAPLPDATIGRGRFFWSHSLTVTKIAQMCKYADGVNAATGVATRAI